MYTLNEALSNLTVDELKKYLHLVPDEQGGIKKAQLVERVWYGLDGHNLQEQYDQLDHLQKLAVADALYDPALCYQTDRFHARHNAYPELSFEPRDRPRYGFTKLYPSRLRLFLYGVDRYQSHPTDNLRIPDDLVARLKAFVPEPAPLQLSGHQEPPISTDEDETFTIRLCEQEALLDLPTVFNLVQQGKLKASAKTGRGSAATSALLANALQNGDFYAVAAGVDSQKPFAWPLLLQAAKLAQVNGSKLELSKSGTRQLAKNSADTLRLLWQRWQKNTLLDEFKRIDEIKGQNSKGRVMTATAPRRQKVTVALTHCPVGEWVGVDDFFNHMVASELSFEVTHDPWRLYICDSEYGMLGYDGFHEWSVLQGRYILCLLFEYASTLGMVDVAYVNPEGERDDFRDNWGSEDLEYLSRYDGLLFFRLNKLGAYCLGLSDNYEPPENVSDCTFTVLPSLLVNLTSGQPTPEDKLLLDTWATEEADNSWKLDKAKTILALESGHDIDTLQTFLQGKDDQPLPEAVEGFITVCKKQGTALKMVAPALLIECSTEQIAATLADHKETAKLCQRAGKKQLVIKQIHEEKFRKAARIVGFGMIS